MHTRLELELMSFFSDLFEQYETEEELDNFQEKLETIMRDCYEERLMELEWKSGDGYVNVR